MHWLSWERLSVHKFFGGMGFKEITYFNVAMLGKHGWKFQTNTTSLVTRLFKARYFFNNDFIGSRLGSNQSYEWKRILTVKNSCEKGAR